MKRMSLALVLVAACDDTVDGGCEYPSAYQPVTATLESADSCRSWELEVDQHLIVNVGITVPDDGSFVECAANELVNVTPWSSPIYSNMEGQGAKWTFDWVGATAGGPEELVVTCTDGTEWSAMVEVAG